MMQNRALAMGGRIGMLIGVALALTIATGAHAATSVAGVDTVPAAPSSEQPKAVNKDAKIMADFTERVQKYVEVHRRLEGTLPGISKESTPQQIDAHQRALEKLIQTERLKGKEGDFFDKDTRALFRRHLGVAFSGPDGADAKAEIMDEYPGPVRIVINGRYPDTIPLSTVPPKALNLLPPLPEELEYRFIGDRLILLDVHAHIVIDAIDKAFRK
jgi:hypothetical protein